MSVHAEARLPRREGQAIARQRRRDDGEGIRRVTAEGRRVGQPRDDVEEFEDRAGPAMHQQQRRRVRPLPRHMQVMQVDPVQRHLELREGVQRGLLRAPVEAVPPMRDEFAEVGGAGAVGPGIAAGRDRRLVRQPGAGQPVAQLGDGLLRDGQREGLGLGGHGRVPPAWREDAPAPGGGEAWSGPARPTSAVAAPHLVRRRRMAFPPQLGPGRQQPDQLRHHRPRRRVQVGGGRPRRSAAPHCAARPW